MKPLMKPLNEIFECIKKDVLEEIRTNENNTFTFNTDLKIPFHKESHNSLTTTTNKQELNKTFYKVMGLSPLDIYIEKININTTVANLFDTVIHSHYRGYTKEMGGCVIFLPFMLANDVFSFFYNNLIILPFVTLQFRNNPTYFFLKIDITLRRSLVQNTITV